MKINDSERKELIRKMTNKICDKYDKALKMIAEDEKKELELMRKKQEGNENGTK